MSLGNDRLERDHDPVVREIGRQLRLGQVTPARLLTVPEYRDVIARGLARLAAASARRPAGTGRGPVTTTRVRSAP